ncbi:hypothetical protein EJC49_04275 [Aquibium carbonis]|uniref:Uncharacterized protein n=2 Tax=Aquibium carbonis TaxID=2495581 RepID=A0A3R9YBQ8_9HYPH|nr:hypothetical protein EJC49_04275 [Aquibium carbonis]
MAIKVAVLFLTAIVPMKATVASASSWHPNVYTVGHDTGGYVIDYALKMRKMERSGRAIRFSGRCDSACTLFLALPEAKACVSRGAAFGFHLPSGSSAGDNRLAANFMLKTYPAWVRRWLAQNGGLTSQLKVMHFDYASRYLPECATVRNVRHPSSAGSQYAFADRD